MEWRWVRLHRPTLRARQWKTLNLWSQTFAASSTILVGSLGLVAASPSRSTMTPSLNPNSSSSCLPQVCLLLFNLSYHYFFGFFWIIWFLGMDYYSCPSVNSVNFKFQVCAFCVILPFWFLGIRKWSIFLCLCGFLGIQYWVHFLSRNMLFKLKCVLLCCLISGYLLFVLKFCYFVHPSMLIDL